ncbi:hypothetical protein [Ruegeria sp.]|nr:hypothetical protein [Ruegeria sp.]
MATVFFVSATLLSLWGYRKTRRAAQSIRANRQRFGAPVVPFDG